MQSLNGWKNVTNILLVIRFGKYLSSEIHIQSSHVISTLLISNNCLSRSEKSGPCFNTEIYQQATKYCGKEEKFLLFSTIFLYNSNFRRQIKYSYVKCGCSIYFFLNSANLIYRATDISNYFRQSLGLRDNESRL